LEIKIEVVVLCERLHLQGVVVYKMIANDLAHLIIAQTYKPWIGNSLL